MKILNLALSIFLFTKSDVPTVLPVVPIVTQTLFPLRASLKMPADVSRSAELSIAASHGLLNLDIHESCVANQRKPSGIAEDALNKSWRPIPAALISHAEATVFRWTLLPICLVISWAYGVVGVGIALAILNAAVYATFDSGATFIARGQGALVGIINSSSAIGH
ncbi:hypothetical protein B0H19DRAFT_1255472 [Mycena capillaripes]|nr:hypothetical protein B0H19DRAFT_1255472 [Mycena capillaripes]